MWIIAVFERDDARLAHIPDIMTMEGIIDIFAVINILELADIVDPNAYAMGGVPGDERLQQIDGRRDARKVRNLIIESLEREPSSVAKGDNRTLEDLYWEFLAQQASTLWMSSDRLEKREIFSWSGGKISSQIKKFMSAHFPREGGSRIFWEKVNLVPADSTFVWTGYGRQTTIRKKKGARLFSQTLEILD
jgi:hypothetical protein